MLPCNMIFGDTFAKAKMYSPRSEACRKFQKIFKKKYNLKVRMIKKIQSLDKYI